jgi:hypothetical protein
MQAETRQDLLVNMKPWRYRYIVSDSLKQSHEKAFFLAQSRSQWLRRRMNSIREQWFKCCSQRDRMTGEKNEKQYFRFL